VVGLQRTDVTEQKIAGKLNRGISVVDTIEILRGQKLEDTEYKKAAILGWAVELVSHSYLH
jgi:farnesyl diphosphate synthase